MRAHWKTILFLASFALAVLYLSGSAVNAALFGLFLSAWLLPACFAVWLVFRKLAMEEELLGLLSFSGAVVIAFPFWFLRSLSGFSFRGFDLAAALIMTGLMVGNWRRGEFFRMLRGQILPRERIWLGLVLPALFCLVWVGFEVHQGRQVRYHGLFPVDFCNLSSMVSLVKASPGLPLDPIAGNGLLHYHWLFFTLPALLSTFLGAGMSSSHALMLCNLAVAVLFFKTLSYVNRRIFDEAGLPHAPLRALGAGLIILAPSVMHFYYGTLSFLNLPWLELGLRNLLLLTLPNSLTAFGNNTFALVLCLLFFCCLDQWQARGRIAWVILAAFCTSLVAGYSITLCFPLALTWGLILVSGRLRQPLRAILPALAVGLIMFLLFAWLGFFTGEKGAIGLSFDSGRFLQNMVCSFPLLAIGVALAIRFPGGWLSKTFLLGLAACLTVPSLLCVKDSPSDVADFSMKISSLMIALAGPLTVCGIYRWFTIRRRSRVWIGALLLLVAVGLLHTAVYEAQFAYRRFFKPDSNCETVNADYFEALNYIRLHSRPADILMDGTGYQSLTMYTTYTAVSISERRLLFTNSSGSPEIEQPNEMTKTRKARWLEWAGAGYRDAATAGYFAALADYLLTTRPVVSGEWLSVARFGDVCVYKSARSGGTAGH